MVYQQVNNRQDQKYCEYEYKLAEIHVVRLCDWDEIYTSKSAEIEPVDRNEI